MLNYAFSYNILVIILLFTDGDTDRALWPESLDEHL